MLDYAANGVKYWPVERLRAQVEDLAAKTGKTGKTGDQLITALRAGTDPEVRKAGPALPPAEWLM